jgi:hypothetical protein
MLAVLMLAPGLPISTIADVVPRAVAPAIIRLDPKSTVKRAPKPAPKFVAKTVAAGELAAFMRRKGFVEPDDLEVILAAAAEASIPASMIVCIEFVESSGGKHFDFETNNPLGWKNGKASFPSVHAAIHHVSHELGSGEWYAGKTIEEKLRVYNPRPAYLEKVMGCMNQFAQ